MSTEGAPLHDLMQRLARRERELEAARRISLVLFQHTHVDELIKQVLQTRARCRRRRGRLDEEEVAILTIISAFGAISIEEAQLFERAKMAELVYLLGDIGHDLKNLLMPVVMGTGMLQNEFDNTSGFFAGEGLQLNQTDL